MLSFLMNNKFQGLINSLNINKVELANRKLDKVVKNYSFYYISNQLSENENQLFIDMIQNSKIIIVDHNKENLHFIIGFYNTIIVIKDSFLNIMKSIFSKNIQISFLNDSKNAFDKYIDLNYIENANINYLKGEITCFNQELLLSPSTKQKFPETTKIWSMIRSCISGYFIKSAYFKLQKNRIVEFSKKSEIPKNIRIYEEDEFIELRFIENGSLFSIYLVYLIENEEIVIIKRPLLNSETSKLVKREIRNYTIMNHPNIPKFYGTTKNNECILIEYIYGSNLSNIKKIHFTEEEKFNIIFQILFIFKFFEFHYI